MKPVIALTIGDPAGIGPEITLKAMLRKDVTDVADCIAVGSGKVLERAAGFCGLGSLRFEEAAFHRESPAGPGVIPLIDMDNADMGCFEMGRISGVCGRAAYEYIERAIALAKRGDVSAVVTAPINKESLRAGGVDYIGHTEIFGALLDAPDPLTMFETRGLRVFFLTRHVSLRQACESITREKLIHCAIRCFDALRRLGIGAGTMAIAGLNPHSGEHGLFGTEEQEHIVPAVEFLRAKGYDVEGPVSADSVFHLALEGRYVSVLSLYHDQGHIATKTYDFERTIALTAGLPFLRTSVDHGTAFDLAGKGVASDVSMAEAIRVAAKYALTYARNSNAPSAQTLTV